MWQASLLDETVIVEGVTTLPLSDFARGSQVVQFRSPVTPLTMFLVPNARFIPDLLERGITRGRIWLADEVRDLLQAQISREDLTRIVESKLLLDGFVQNTTKESR